MANNTKTGLLSYYGSFFCHIKITNDKKKRFLFLVLDEICILISSMCMSLMRSSILAIGLTTVFFSGHALLAEESRGSFRSTKIGIIQQNYSGSSNKSFALGSPGTGLELTLDNGYSLFRYFFKTRFTVSEGTQNFLNSGTVFNSNYKFSQFAPELGLSFFPIPRRDKGVNIFLWGLGAISYNNLELKNLPTTTTLQSKEQAFGYGYGGGLGFELVIAPSSGGSRYLVYGEVGFRDERADLAKTQFEISGMTYSLGFGF